jgi:hypothetical protein
MTTAGTGYGSLKYASPTQRALGTITDENFKKVADDQAALLSEMQGDITYMASQLRKTQAAVDQADENVIQQLQDLFDDILVLLGGGGDTGLDFGDLKYYFQAMGALFDLTDANGNLIVPVNLFQAAENFINNYVIPTGNWQAYMDEVTDESLASMVNLLGGIPIIGQAAEQLAQIIAENRDNTDLLNSYLTDMWNTMNLQNQDQWTAFWAQFNTLWNSIQILFQPLDDAMATALAPVLDALSQWNAQNAEDTQSFIDQWNAWIAGISEATGGEQLDIGNTQQILVDIFTILGEPPGLGTGLTADEWATNWVTEVAANNAAWTNWVNSLASSVGIPVSNLTNEQTDYQTDSGFDDPASVELGDDPAWSRDAGVGRTAPGSLKLVADGSFHSVRGNNVPVAEDNQVNLSVWVKWENLTGSGLPIQLRLRLDDGTEETLASIPNLTVSSDWVQLQGSKVIDIGITNAWTRLVVTETAATGTIWFDDAPDVKTLTLISMEWVRGLSDWNNEYTASQDAFATMLTSWWTALTTPAQSSTDIWDAIDAAMVTYYNTNTAINSEQSATFTQILKSLGYDPTTGLQSPGTIDGLGESWTQLGAALSGDLADSGQWSWLAQIMITWFGISSNAHSIGVDNSNTLGIRNNVPSFVGLDNTSEANMPVTGVNFTSPIGININQADATAIGLIRCANASTKGSLSFLCAAPSTGTLTAFYINAFKLDPATGILVYLWSQDVHNLVPTSKGWVQYVFTTAQRIDVNPGDVLAFEFQGVCSNSPSAIVAMYGQVSGVPNHPTAVLPNVGGARLAPGTAPPSSNIAALGWEALPNAPYVAVEIVGDITQIYPPNPVTITSTGTSSYTISPWLDTGDFVDVIALGDGGGGEGELGGATGYGGTGGSWASRRLVVGTDIAKGGTLNFNIGSGGAGGPYFTAGTDGTGTTVQYTKPGVGVQTITAAAGFGGNHTLGYSHNTLGQGLAPSPNPYTFEGQDYYGGTDQYLNYPGNVPGGGGQGAQPFAYGTAGARGQVWLMESQAT